MTSVRRYVTSSSTTSSSAGLERMTSPTLTVIRWNASSTLSDTSRASWSTRRRATGRLLARRAAGARRHPLYEVFCAAPEAEGVTVVRGVFGARMEVELLNDGPVTIVLDG